MNIRQLSAAAFALAVSTCAWAQTAPATAPADAPATAPGATAPAATAPAKPAASGITADSLKTDKEKMSYALGLTLGDKLGGVEIDLTAFGNGIKDGSADTPVLTDKDIEDTLTKLQGLVMAQAEARANAVGDKNQKDGDAYLAANAKKDGVKTTASGLQYRVLKSGTGKTPKATDTVSVNYRGTLITGKEFDASKDAPVSFPVNGVIPGWTEALQLMKEGDKWEIVIPAKLAYGERGTQGGPIGPNEVLIFEVELLSVK